MNEYDAKLEVLKTAISDMAWEHSKLYIGEVHNRDWWADEIMRRMKQVELDYEYAL